MVEFVRVAYEPLKTFCRAVFAKYGLSPQDAETSADVLLAADLRGIPSHGIARMQRYVNGLKKGLMVANAEIETVMETPTSLVLDAHGAMGAPVSVRAMNTVIDKARQSGAAFACVRDSNHFGIAGYYAIMAMRQDMLGLTMTNTALLGVPTFARKSLFGTNPIAFAAPADQERGFVLDMATTVVTRGKIEVYQRLEKPLPEGWAVDKTGRSASDAGSLLEDMVNRAGGGILPLGGLGEMFGGHKGYGLAIMVDILCAVLCAAPFGAAVADTPITTGRVSHFFGAMRIDAFRDPAEFKRDMDHLLCSLRTTPPAEGQERVYYAGLKEWEQEDLNRVQGLPMVTKTYDQLCAIGSEAGFEMPPIIATGSGELPE